MGAVAAFVASTLGALIVALGHSQPDVVQPFWECGEYVLLIGGFNLLIYGALLWQVRRLTRRDGRKTDADRLAGFEPGEAEEETETARTERLAGRGGETGRAKLPGTGVPRVISRQVVRRSASSLKPGE